MVRINSRDEVTELAAPQEVRQWVNSLNRLWQPRPRGREPYDDEPGINSAQDWQIQQQNLRTFERYIIGPRGWTIEVVEGSTGGSAGIRVPELEQWEHECGIDAALEARRADSLPKDLEEGACSKWNLLFTLNAHLVLAGPYHRQQTDLGSDDGGAVENGRLANGTPDVWKQSLSQELKEATDRFRDGIASSREVVITNKEEGKGTCQANTPNLKRNRTGTCASRCLKTSAQASRKSPHRSLPPTTSWRRSSSGS